jgi:hypothetical protein
MSESNLNQPQGSSTPPAAGPDSIACPQCGHVNPAWRSLCESCDMPLKAGVSAKTSKISKPKKNDSGLCQKCNTRPGDPYTFHYLKQIGTNKTPKLSDYKDGGTETVTLCGKCVSQHHNKELLQFGFLSIFFLVTGLASLGIFIAALIRGGFSAIFLASGSTLTLLGIGSVGLWIKAVRGGANFSGVSLAMDIWKKWLSEQGYATLLFEDEYAKLKARG